MLINIGSYSVQNIVGRESRDLDLLCTLADFKEAMLPNLPVISGKNHAFVKSDRIYDCEIIWPNSLSLELAEIILAHEDTRRDDDIKAWVAPLNILYMLKMSHRYRKDSPHFMKTMRDIRAMRVAGAVIEDHHFDFYHRRMNATYSYAHPDLSLDKATFFNPLDEFYIYDHDSIHAVVALGDKPAYTRYARDGQEVLSSKKKFFEVDESVRLAGVYEEACVLALERSQIPNNFKPNPRWSFYKALEKVCSSITSGWFREFAWENYAKVADIYEQRGTDNYVARFRENSHMLLPYRREETV